MERLSDRQLLRLYNAAKAISAREADMMPDVVKLCEELMEFRALKAAGQKRREACYLCGKCSNDLVDWLYQPAEED